MTDAKYVHSSSKRANTLAIFFPSRMLADVSVSVSPHALAEVIACMRMTVQETDYEAYVATWAKVDMALQLVSMWAVHRADPRVRRVLHQLKALLQMGEWEATALDVEPHPKLPGMCLLRATMPSWETDWEQTWPWAKQCYAGNLTKCRKILSELAWHLSLRGHTRAEFQRCVLAARMLRSMQRTLRGYP